MGNRSDDLKKLIWFFYLIISSALTFTGFGAGTGNSHGWAAMTALLWALSAMAAGVAVGFLFGIPKILQGVSRSPEGTAAQQIAHDAYRQQVNTNLTEISDWLTKIIVGLGLINLKQIPPFIRSKAGILAESLKQADPTKDYLGFAVAVLACFAILGFLFGYIFTRIYLAAAFARADLGGIQLFSDAANGRFESLNDSMALKTIEVKQLADTVARLDRTVAEDTEQKAKDSAEIKPSPQFSAALSRDIPAPKPLLAPKPPLDLHNQIRDLAKAYNEVSSISKVERVQIRNEIANQMAAMINKGEWYRDWAVSEALEQNNAGLIAGLATAINAGPLAGDAKRLFAVAPHVPYKHARYKVAAALGCLFDAKIATQDDIQPALTILSNYYKEDSDPDLRRRVRQTLAQISQSTGRSVGITPS